MPRTNLGRNFPGMALAGLLAFLAGCVPRRRRRRPPRANLHDSQDAVIAGIPAPPAPRAGHAAARGHSPRMAGQRLRQLAYGASAADDHALFRSQCRCLRGPRAIAPAGPAAASPYDAANAPAGPPPGYAGPGPSAPMTVSPVSRIAEEVG